MLSLVGNSNLEDNTTYLFIHFTALIRAQCFSKVQLYTLGCNSQAPMKEIPLQFLSTASGQLVKPREREKKILYGMITKKLPHPYLITEVVGVFPSLKALSCVFSFLILPSLGLGSVFLRAGNQLFQTFPNYLPKYYGKLLIFYYLGNVVKVSLRTTKNLASHVQEGMEKCQFHFTGMPFSNSYNLQQWRGGWVLEDFIHPSKLSLIAPSSVSS